MQPTPRRSPGPAPPLSDTSRRPSAAFRQTRPTRSRSTEISSSRSVGRTRLQPESRRSQRRRQLAPASPRHRSRHLRNGVVANGHIPVTVNWGAAPGTYSLAAGHLDESVDGGSWVARTPAGESSAATTLAFGHGYHFRAQVGDSAGPNSAWKSGAAGTLKLKDDAASGLQGRPTGAASDTTAVDGRIHRSSAGTASVTLRFTGRSVAVIAPRGPRLASFSATLDGVSEGVITPSATTTSARHTIAIYSFATVGNHTLVLHVRRGPGATPADLDADAILDGRLRAVANRWGQCALIGWGRADSGLV